MRRNNSEGDLAVPLQRQRMTPGARRAHILDVAQALFLARGWDIVTVSDVLEAAGISKGGFYHHFAAKEDLIDGVVERFTKVALAAVASPLTAASGGALPRFNAFLSESIRWKAEHAHEMRLILDAILQPGNDYLFQRVSDTSSKVVMPILREMIADGVTEGCFSVPNINLVAEMIMALSAGRKSVMQMAVQTAEAGHLEDATALLNDRMVDEGALIDRLLDLPMGSIALSSPAEYSAMLRFLTHDRGAKL